MTLAGAGGFVELVPNHLERAVARIIGHGHPRDLPSGSTRPTSSPASGLFSE